MKGHLRIALRSATSNVLWKYCRAGLLAKEQTLMRLNFCDNLIDEYWTISLNIEEALSEAIHLNHSVYDSLYLTIARTTGATLLTQHKTLKDLALQQGVEVL